MKLLLASAEFLPFRGGVAEVVHGLAEGLSGEGCEVTVLTRADYARARHVSNEYRLAGYPFKRGMSPRAEIMMVSLWLAGKLLLPRAIIGADLITQRALSLLPARALRLRPHWLVSYGSEVLQHAATGRVSRRNKLFACCRGVIAISRFTADLVVQAFPRTPVEVIYPGIREELFTAPEDTAQVASIREALGNRMLILCVGRLDPRKGQDTLIRVLPELANLGIKPLAAFLGDGPYKPHLELLVRQAGVGGQVRFLGNVSEADKVAWLDAADMVAQPSRREGLMVEGLGLALAEAGARGKAVVASRHGGIPEVVRDGVTGVLVEEDAPPERWARTILELAVAPERRRELGNAARSHVAAHFRWTLAAAAAVRLIRSRRIGREYDN